jgi:hypothetical protein
VSSAPMHLDPRDSVHCTRRAIEGPLASLALFDSAAAQPRRYAAGEYQLDRRNPLDASACIQGLSSLHRTRLVGVHARCCEARRQAASHRQLARWPQRPHDGPDSWRRVRDGISADGNRPVRCRDSASSADPPRVCDSNHGSHQGTVRALPGRRIRLCRAMAASDRSAIRQSFAPRRPFPNARQPAGRRLCRRRRLDIICLRVMWLIAVRPVALDTVRRRERRGARWISTSGGGARVRLSTGVTSVRATS